MAASNINTLCDLWAATLLKHYDTPPFASCSDLYNTIDSTPLGDVPWQSFSLTYQGELPGDTTPSWMTSEYDVWFRDPHTIVQNMIRNPDYNHYFDTAPVRVFDHDGSRKYQNFMSGDWAWEEAVCFILIPSCHTNVFFPKDEIAKDPTTPGAMLVPIILGSDKTTVSIATGNNEYYPLYMSIGCVYNNIRRAHRGALALVAFLSIPKSEYNL